jgi:hypothetical protein
LECCSVCGGGLKLLVCQYGYGPEERFAPAKRLERRCLHLAERASRRRSAALALHAAACAASGERAAEQPSPARVAVTPQTESPTAPAHPPASKTSTLADALNARPEARLRRRVQSGLAGHFGT